MTTTIPPAAAGNPWPYRARLVWFIALIVVYTLWFERHLKAFVSQTAIIGGTVTLFGLWKLLLDAIGTASREGPGDWMRRAFASPRATEYLGFATLLLVAMYLCTSSIYLTFDDDKRGPSSFTVEQWQGNRLMHKPEQLNAYDRFLGRPYFFHFDTEKVELRIVDPPGYEPLEIDWTLGSQHTVPVPRGFRKKELHLLQIVPALPLLGALPETPDKPGLKYRLELRKSGASGADAGATIYPFWRTVVYTGMAADELRATANESARDGTRRALKETYDGLQVPAEGQAQILAQLFAKPELRAIERLVANDQIEIRLSSVKQDEAGQETTKLVASRTFKVPPGDSRVHLIVLDPVAGGSP